MDIPATSDAIPGTLVLRDASGDLSAGQITADLTGDVTGNLTGNVTGDVTGDVTGNLTGNVTGDVTGDVTGNLTGNVTGNVTGNLTGTASAIADSTVTNAKVAANAGIEDTKLATISTAGKVSNSATTATSDSTPDTIVSRDANGISSFGGLKTTSASDVLLSTRTTAPFRINHTDGSGRVNLSWNVDGANHNIGTAKYFNTDPSLRFRMTTTGFEFYTAPAGVAGDLISAWTVGLYNSIEGRVAVGTTTPDAAAALDVTSTTRGFLPPRMTTGERDAISSPPAGLILYNSTTNKLQVRTNTAWVDPH